MNVAIISKMNEGSIGDTIEGFALANAQSKNLIADERRWLWEQEYLLRIGVKLPVTEQDLVMAQSIGKKFDNYRYGKG